MKRGNLNLSINSIVVLILAITMLGLGLAFMRNIFGDATEQFGQVSEEMRTEMASKMKGISAAMDLNIHEVEVGVKEDNTIYMGVKNDQGSASEFTIVDVTANNDYYSCLGGNDLSNFIELTYPTGSRYIEPNSVDVIPVRIDGKEKGRCRIEFSVEKEDDSGSTYSVGSRNVYVYVE